MPHQQLPGIDGTLEQALRSAEMAFTISDPTQPDHPIVFASCKFYELTGYSEHEVLGRNCRFLQGPDTERRKVTEIRDAIREHRPCQVCILNYRKGGERFWNQFYLSPVRNAAGELVHYVGIQADVTQQVVDQQRQSVGAVGPPEPADAARVSDVDSDEEGGLACELRAAEDGAREVAQQEQQLAGHIQGLLHTATASTPPDAPCAPPPVHLPCSLVLPLLKIQQSFVLVDPKLPDMPIVHVSDTFLKMTGYLREQVVGRNCRFLQGPGTDRAEVARLRDAVTATPARPITVRLLNYTAAGRPFWNLLQIAPVRGADGAVMFFVGVQLDVSDVAGPEAAAVDTGAPPLAHTPSLSLSQKMAHQGVTGAVRVAVRALGGDTGLRRSIDHQAMPHSPPLMPAPVTPAAS